MRSGWTIAGIVISVVAVVLMACLVFAGVTMYFVGRTTSAALNSAMATALAVPEYRRIDVSYLIRDPELFNGLPVVFPAKVVSVDADGSEATIEVVGGLEDSSTQETVIVTYSGPLPTLDDQQLVEIRGRGEGSRTVDGVLRPLVRADEILLQP